jgi:hypothetical protein
MGNVHSVLVKLQTFIEYMLDPLRLIRELVEKYMTGHVAKRSEIVRRCNCIKILLIEPNRTCEAKTDSKFELREFHQKLTYRQTSLNMLLGKAHSGRCISRGALPR